MDLIDFTECERNDYRAYGGASGSKINILYEGHAYMLKFPPKPNPTPELSYVNACLTEHIACRIFETMGFQAQKTLLGTYTDARGKVKRVVACRDFSEGGKKLIEFAHLKNTCVDSGLNGYGTDLESILGAIDEQRLMISDKLRAFFWDQFIGDALLANFDRHNGNWGLLVNERIKHVDIAPVYDCGSCLFPQTDEERMAKVLATPAEISARVKTFPKSTIMRDKARINYYEFITSLENAECDAALARVYNHVDLDRIEGVLDDTPGLTPLEHRFYMKIITERKRKILDAAMEALESPEGK